MFVRIGKETSAPEYAEDKVEVCLEYMYDSELVKEVVTGYFSEHSVVDNKPAGKGQAVFAAEIHQDGHDVEALVGWWLLCDWIIVFWCYESMVYAEVAAGRGGTGGFSPYFDGMSHFVDCDVGGYLWEAFVLKACDEGDSFGKLFE